MPTFKCGPKVQDDKVCWVEVAIGAAGSRAGRGFGGWQRQPQFVQTLRALRPLKLFLDPLLVRLLPRWAAAAPHHANLQALTQNLVNKGHCYACVRAHSHQCERAQMGNVLQHAGSFLQSLNLCEHCCKAVVNEHPGVFTDKSDSKKSCTTHSLTRLVRVEMSWRDPVFNRGFLDTIRASRISAVILCRSGQSFFFCSIFLNSKHSP